jgi:hypothetical protein
MQHFPFLRPIAALSVLAFANIVSAQSMSITPGGTVSAGSTITVSYYNPSNPGGTVMIQISHGVNPPVVHTFPVVLNAQGEGSIQWKVPRVRFVYVGAPGVPQQVIAVS